MKRALLCLLLLAAPVFAAADEPPDRLRELERRVAELEKKIAALSATTDAETRRVLEELRKEIEALSREIETLRTGVPEKKGEAPVQAVPGLGPAAARVYHVERGVSIGGYGEAIYRNFAAHRQDGSPSGADDRVDLTRVVLYFGYKFDERFLFNSEIEYAHAVAASDKSGEVEVEFAYLDYRHRRPFNLRAGLLLIPMGIVNELHEPPVFLGALRPDVEQLLIPSTWRELGLGAYGDAGPVAYRLYLVNGLSSAGFDATGIREGRQEGSLALARNWAVTGRADVTSLPGAVLGVSFFTGDSGQGRRTPSGRGFSGRTTVVDLHGEWRWRGVDLRALWVDSRVSDAAAINEANGFSGEESVGSRQKGWYVQGGFDVLAGRAGGRASLTPFLRYEEYDTQASVPEGFARNPENDVNVCTVGAVFKPIANIAIKADWQRRRNAASTGVNQFNVGLGWLF
jgi:uncharacterized coiled-coil protein SlyX